MLKSFKPVILQLMAFRFLKQVGTTLSYNLVVTVNDDYTLDVEGLVFFCIGLPFFFLFSFFFFALWSLM